MQGTKGKPRVGAVCFELVSTANSLLDLAADEVSARSRDRLLRSAADLRLLSESLSEEAGFSEVDARSLRVALYGLAERLENAAGS